MRALERACWTHSVRPVRSPSPRAARSAMPKAPGTPRFSIPPAAQIGGHRRLQEMGARGAGERTAWERRVSRQIPPPVAVMPPGPAVRCETPWWARWGLGNARLQLRRGNRRQCVWHFDRVGATTFPAPVGNGAARGVGFGTSARTSRRRRTRRNAFRRRQARSAKPESTLSARRTALLPPRVSPRATMANTCKASTAPRTGRCRDG